VSALVPPDDEVVADLAAKVTWVKTGTAITNVLMQYTDDAGTHWYNIVNNLENDITTLVANNQNYPWTPPADVISDLCQIRITDPDNSAAQGVSASDFIVASKVIVDQPDVNDSGVNGWEANQSYFIEWRKWGTFATVNLYYRPNSGSGWVLLNEGGPVDSDNLYDDGLNGKWSWFVDEDVVLSPTAEIKVEDSVNTNARLVVISDQFTTMGSLEVLLA